MTPFWKCHNPSINMGLKYMSQGMSCVTSHITSHITSQKYITWPNFFSNILIRLCGEGRGGVVRGGPCYSEIILKSLIFTFTGYCQRATGREREGEMLLPQKMVGDWCWWRASHHSCAGPQGVELAPQRTRDGREREMLLPQKIVRDWCWRRAEHHITAVQVPSFSYIW